MDELRRVRRVVSRAEEVVGEVGRSVMDRRRLLRVVIKVSVRAVVEGSKAGVERRRTERVVERHWFIVSSGPGNMSF